MFSAFFFSVSLFIYNLISQPEIFKKKNKIVTEELNSKNQIIQPVGKNLSKFPKLTSAIAHEIRQPLNSIKTLTDGVILLGSMKNVKLLIKCFRIFFQYFRNVDKIDEIIKSLRLR